MRLFHYTSSDRAVDIIRTKLIKPSESNIGSPWEGPLHPYGKHAGPPAVDLIDTPTPTPGNTALTSLSLARRAVRVTVEVPHGIRWQDWEYVAYMDPKWRQMVIDKAGMRDSLEHWYVVPGAIRPHFWVSMHAQASAGKDLALGPTADEYGYHEVLAALPDKIRAQAPILPNT